MTTLNGSFSGFINGWGPDWWGEEDPNIADQGVATFNLSSYTSGTFSAVTLSWTHSGYGGESEKGQRYILSHDYGIEFFRGDCSQGSAFPDTTGALASLATYLNDHKGNSALTFLFNCDAGDYYDGNWSLLTGMGTPTLTFTWTPSGGGTQYTRTLTMTASGTGTVKKGAGIKRAAAPGATATIKRGVGLKRAYAGTGTATMKRAVALARAYAAAGGATLVKQARRNMFTSGTVGVIVSGDVNFRASAPLGLIVDETAVVNYLMCYNAAWATARSGGGTLSVNTATSARVQAYVSGNYYVSRVPMQWDTSAVPNDATITDARILWCAGYYSSPGTNAQIVASTHANWPPTTADFTAVGTTAFTDAAVDMTGAYSERVVVLNAAGIAAISKTGTTKLAVVAADDFSNTTPTTSGTRSYIRGRPSSLLGQGFMPTLQLTWTAGSQQYTRTFAIDATGTSSVTKRASMTLAHAAAGAGNVVKAISRKLGTVMVAGYTTIGIAAPNRLSSNLYLPTAYLSSTNATWATARSGYDPQQTLATTGPYVGSRLYAGQYTVYRLPLQYDTSSIPDDATDLVADLTVCGKQFSSPGAVIALVTSTHENWPPDGDDFALVGTTRLTDTDFDLLGSTVVQRRISLNAAGIAAISKTGLTKFALLGAKDVDNTAPTVNYEYSRAYAGFYDPSGAPLLTVSWTVAGQQYTRTFSASATGGATLVKRVGLPRALAGSGALALARRVALPRAYTATGTETSLKRVGVKRSYTATGTGGFAKAWRKALSLAFTALGTALLTKKAAKQVAIPATGTNTVTKRAGIKRAFTASGAGSIIMRAVKLMTLAFSASGTAGMTKRWAKGLVLTFSATGSGALKRLVALRRAIAPTGTGSVARGVRLSRSFVASGASVITKRFGRTLAVAATASSNLLKKVGKVASSTAVGQAAIAWGMTYRRTLAVSATGTPTLGKTLALHLFAAFTATGEASMTFGRRLHMLFEVTATAWVDFWSIFTKGKKGGKARRHEGGSTVLPSREQTPNGLHGRLMTKADPNSGERVQSPNGLHATRKDDDGRPRASRD